MLIISKGVHFLIFLLVCYWPLSMNEGSESCISWIEERGDSLFPQHTHLSSLISIISHLVPALVGCSSHCHVHPSLILTAPPSTIHILPPPSSHHFLFLLLLQNILSHTHRSPLIQDQSIWWGDGWGKAYMWIALPSSTGCIFSWDSVLWERNHGHWLWADLGSHPSSTTMEQWAFIYQRLWSSVFSSVEWRNQHQE